MELLQLGGGLRRHPLDQLGVVCAVARHHQARQRPAAGARRGGAAQRAEQVGGKALGELIGLSQRASGVQASLLLMIAHQVIHLNRP